MPVKCPCCGWESDKFQPAGLVPRPNALCPNCGLLERHRALWMFLQNRTGFFQDNLKVLHFGPEEYFRKMFGSLKNLEYYNADIESDSAMMRVDITKIPFKDDSFDVILCYHVLEHVEDDRKALAELFRVLKPQGWAVLQSPVDWQREHTFEDPNITAAGERLKAFGQEDHVRIYGRDYLERIKLAGFKLELVNILDDFTPNEIKLYGLRDEKIFHCLKPLRTTVQEDKQIVDAPDYSLDNLPNTVIPACPESIPDASADERTCGNDEVRNEQDQQTLQTKSKYEETIEAGMNTDNSKEYSDSARLQALINLLESKGLISQREIEEELKRLSGEAESKVIHETESAKKEAESKPVKAETVHIAPEKQGKTSDIKVTIDGPQLDISGYAYFTRSLTLGLDKRGADVSVINKWFGGAPDVKQVEENAPAENGAIYLKLEGKRYRYKTQVDYDKVQRIVELDNAENSPQGRTYIACLPPVGKNSSIYKMIRDDHPGYAKYIGYTMFEMADVSRKWIDSCRYMDEIWVPSSFNRDTFARGGYPKEKIKIVPIGIDIEVYNPDKVVPMLIPGIKGFNFLANFQWSKRKGWDILLQAYLKAFTKDDDAALVIRAYHSDGSSIEDRIRKYVAHLGYDINQIPRIAVVSERISEKNMPSLFKACQAYVLPTRGEGWGLPYMEAMAMSLPVLATRFSAHLDFMNDDNSYLIDKLGTESVDEEQLTDNPVYLGTSWGIPSLEHTAELMRHVYDNREEAANKGVKARKDIMNNWTIEHQIDAAVKALNPNIDFKRSIEAPLVIKSRKDRPLRILMQNRPNTLEAPGGDTIVMQNLKGGLERLGVKVDFGFRLESLKDYDVVHAFNFVLPEMVKMIAQNAMREKKPFVVTTLYEDLEGYLYKSLKAAALFKEYLDKGQPEGFMEEKLARLHLIKPHPIAENSFTVRQAAALMPCGETEAEHIRRDYPFARRIKPVKYGCNIKDIDVSPELFIRDTGLKDFVLCVGRIESRKNQLMLLKALEDDDIPVVFASGGFTYQPKYAEMCQRFKRRGQTVFLDRLSDEMLVSAYKAAKVHALPSWYELPGLVTLEAAYYGCNIAASSWGCIKDYLGGHVHYCEPDKPETIREAVIKALSQPVNPELKRLVSQFTWERAAKETIEVYREAVEEHGGIERLMDEAVKHRSAGDMKTSLDNYLKVLNIAPDRLEALSVAGGLLAAEGDPRGSVMLKRLKINQEDSEKRFEIKAPLKLDDDWKFEEADALEEVNKLIESRDYLKAEDLLQKKLQGFPSDHKALAAMGRVLFLRGKFKEAHEYVEKSVDIQPEGETLVLLAEILEKLNKCEKALATIDLLKEMPGINGHYDFDIQRLMGHCLLKQGKLEEAESCYHKAHEYKPDSEKPYLGLGSACLLRKDYQTAERYLKTALKMNPASEKAHLGLGILYLEQDNAGRAALEFDETLFRSWIQWVSGAHRGCGCVQGSGSEPACSCRLCRL
ncbi:MAG: glycosyltransferase [FCB group bacterium]|nr:glycosyltransferase [FCB group bacterium]